MDNIEACEYCKKVIWNSKTINIFNEEVKLCKCCYSFFRLNVEILEMTNKINQNIESISKRLK